jgi:predicted molibdopterin-dependent oxidoreductase YjgC
MPEHSKKISDRIRARVLTRARYTSLADAGAQVVFGDLKCHPGVVFIPMHFAEAAANLLTIDALDATAKISEYKVCAVSLTLAKEEELINAEARTQRGRW